MVAQWKALWSFRIEGFLQECQVPLTVQKQVTRSIGDIKKLIHVHMILIYTSTEPQ